jgi:hypothetical protein
MPTPTSGFHEQLVNCDVGDLTNVPPYTDKDWIALKGASPSQVTFAANVRQKKMDEWKPDLSEPVYQALAGIADATWWLANQQSTSSTIRWPKSWTAPANGPVTEGQLKSGIEAVSKIGQEALKNAGITGRLLEKDVEQFDQFARRVCQMPEMAYLTTLALLFRQTSATLRGIPPQPPLPPSKRRR